MLDRNLIAGRARIGADVELSADREYRIRVHADVRVGLKDLDFVARWSVDPGSDDLVITQEVTNNGREPISLSAFVSTSGFSHQRRVIGELQPGQTTKRTIRLAGRAERLAGKQVYVGISELNGSLRLNRVLEIPADPRASNPDERLASHE